MPEPVCKIRGCCLIATLKIKIIERGELSTGINTCLRQQCHHARFLSHFRAASLRHSPFCLEPGVSRLIDVANFAEFESGALLFGAAPCDEAG